MKILLVLPISDERFNCIPDIGNGYLAACARQAGHEVELLDCLLERYDYAEFARHLTRSRPDVVGMKTYSCDLGTVREMLRIVRRVLPGAVTVIGGPHPSCEFPERLVQQLPEAHYAFAGEAETGFVQFLAALAAGGTGLGDVPGLIRRAADGTVHANPRAWVEDLDSLPLPAWDLIDPRRYRWGYSFMTSELPAAPMSMTRGCPYTCTFCGSHLMTGRKVRKRSVENIIAEIKVLQRDYGVRSIDVVDENFAFDRRLIQGFCERLLGEDIRIGWNCPYGVRLDSLDEPLVRLMERSGCFGLSVGVESGSQRVLDSIKKRLDVEMVREQVAMIKRVSDIMLQGYFMLGFPGETRGEMEATIQLARSLPFDIVTFCPLRVTPGTDIYADLVAKGAIPSDVDYQGLGHSYFVRSYSELSDEEMRRVYRRAHSQFYFRIPVILRLLRQTRTLGKARTLFYGLAKTVWPTKRTSA